MRAPSRAAAPRDPGFAARFRAVRDRDAGCDGMFVTGVRSTGLYCRPSCPSPTPDKTDVEFFPTTAAAQQSGYRGCARCLPDAAPGSALWNARDTAAARAIRLLDDGVGERQEPDALAGRVGSTPGELARGLAAEAGAGADALALARRAHTAWLLLRETALPIAQVAAATGFPGPQSLEAAFARLYRLRPGELREPARRTDPAEEGGGIRASFFLEARAPFDAAGILGFLRERAVAGVAVADGTAYSRSLRLPHGAGTASVSPSTTRCGVVCELELEAAADLTPALARIRRLLDLDADPAAIDESLARDPVLAPLVAARPGMRLPGAVDAHETLFRAVIGQQVSVAAARTALGRLAEAIGTPLAQVSASGVNRLFPSAAAIAENGRSILRGPRQRIDTVIRLAEALASGDLVLDAGQPLGELTTRLTSFRGIGPWSAGYVAMRVLGAGDVLLTGDVALRAGAARLGLPSQPAALSAHAVAWAPWRSYAGMHLWRGPRVAS